MAGIGAVTCTFVRGDLPQQKARLDVYYCPGLDNPGAHYLGLGDAAFAVRAILFDTPANVVTWAANLQALQGTVVTITNDWGTAYASCLLVQVGQLQRSPVGLTGARGEVTIQGTRSA